MSSSFFVSKAWVSPISVRHSPHSTVKLPAHNSFGITSGKRDNHMEEAHKLPRGRSCCCRRLRLPRELSSSCVASPPYYCCYCLQALRESRNAGVVGAAVRLHLPRFRLGSSTASSCRGEVSGFPPGTCARLSRRTCEEGPVGHQQKAGRAFLSLGTCSDARVFLQWECLAKIHFQPLAP